MHLSSSSLNSNTRLMGRNKFSQREIDFIGKLLRRKCSANRFQQKQIRHILRTELEFSISDFGVQGKAFGPDELQECIRRGIIQILDDATISAMKAKRARDKAKDAAARQAEGAPAAHAAPAPEADWQAVLKEWEDYYNAEATDEQQPG